jgi:ribose/xylose/arabinose/galactoside ABC-type transport system permease subunit
MLSVSSQSFPVTVRRGLPAEIGVAVVLVLVFGWFALRVPHFTDVENLRLLVKQSAQLAVVAAGMTLVIATGGIDISVGSIVGLCAMTLGALASKAGIPLEVAILGATASGAACGLFNGLLITRAGLPPIIVTLAMFAAARAGASLFNGGHSISDLPAGLNETFDRTNLAGFPLLFWVGLAALVVCGVLLRKTTFGRQLLALGGNRDATRLAGNPTKRVETLVYVLSGALAGFAAVLNTAQKATATPDAGLYLELTAITAVVLGGTVITGGQATVLGTGLGVLTIGTLISGVRLSGQEDRVAWFLIGLALLLAVEVQKARTRSKTLKR